MKRIIISILSSFTIISCGKPSVPHEFDPWFQVHLDNFKEQADYFKVEYGSLDTITVFKFDDLNKYPGASKGANAICFYQSKNTDDNNKNLQHLEESLMLDRIGVEYHIFYKSIVFSEEVKKFTKKYQYQIFLHEIGHCAYNLSHDKEDYKHVMSAHTIEIPEEKAEEELTYFFKNASENKDNWFSENQPNN
jgi:hypothetical protein